MILLVLGILFAAAGIRLVSDREERSRHRESAAALCEDLERLFNGIYPGYATSDKLRFLAWCQRKRIFWGPWTIVIIAVCDPGIRLNVTDIGSQEILRILREQIYGSAVIYFNVLWRKNGNAKRRRTTLELRRRAVNREAERDAG